MGDRPESEDWQTFGRPPGPVKRGAADLPPTPDGPFDTGDAAAFPTMLRLVTWPQLEEVIGPAGLLAQALPGYERRPGQELMMRAVATAIERRLTLAVEAGTGTGKSLAYLLPAALAGEQVILSTGTKTLQDQLLHEQVPFVRSSLGLDIEAAVLKGRANYLCLHALEAAERTPHLALDRRDELAQIQAWAKVTETGDRAELESLDDRSPMWSAVSVDAEQCLASRCPSFDACFVMAARRRAERADLIIVNHHLFFADLSLRARAGFALLPPARAVIFDEAHHLEDIAATHFGFSVSDYRLRRLGYDTRALFKREREPLRRLRDDLDQLNRDVERLFGLFAELLPRARYDVHQLSDVIVTAWRRLDNTLEALTQGLDGSASADAQRLSERLASARRELGYLVTGGLSDHVTWVDRGTRAVFLRAAPVEVGDALSGSLFEHFSAVVFTSATLTTTGTFEHFRRRLGLSPDAPSLAVASPFDYRRQALLYLPQDLPEPRSPDFVGAIADRIEALVRLTDGRALLLFTSHRVMRLVHTILQPKLPYLVLCQGEGAKESLLRRLREVPNSVLFATQTFWEGVDVVGEALSLVVIDKLPFAPPGDPLVEARIDALRRARANPFVSYQVPRAIITLKQGVGRLIRHQKDRGIVAILDRRLMSQRYGRAFLDSLPPAPRIATLEALSARWEALSVETSESSAEEKATTRLQQSGRSTP